MKLFKKILSYTISITTGILFLLTLLLIIIGIKANKDNTIAELFGYSYSVVATDSMDPTIKVGDVVIAKNKPYGLVQVDDIAVFYSETKQVYIVHRVIEILDNGNLITQGDNPNATIDEEQVTPEKYVGVVISNSSFLSIGKFILQYRGIVYVLIILIFLFIIIKETITIIKIYSKKTKEDIKEQLDANLKLDYEKEKAKIKKQILEDLKDFDEGVNNNSK